MSGRRAPVRFQQRALRIRKVVSEGKRAASLMLSEMPASKCHEEILERRASSSALPNICTNDKKWPPRRAVFLDCDSEKVPCHSDDSTRRRGTNVCSPMLPPARLVAEIFGWWLASVPIPCFSHTRASGMAPLQGRRRRYWLLSSLRI